MVIEVKGFGKANVQVLCMRSIRRLFYKLPFKLFLSLNPNPQIFNVEIMRLLLSRVLLRVAIVNFALICRTAHAFTSNSI